MLVSRLTCQPRHAEQCHQLACSFGRAMRFSVSFPVCSPVTGQSIRIWDLVSGPVSVSLGSEIFDEPLSTSYSNGQTRSKVSIDILGFFTG